MNLMYPASDFIGIAEVPEGNDIRYGQDHGFHQGIPAGRYSVYRFGSDGRKLVAPGYGMHGAYGNGPLFVRDSENLVFSQLSQGVNSNMAPQVFDVGGTERNWQWLQERYGNVQFLNAGPGRKFRLVRVDETEGPATLKVRVINSDGVPQVNQAVANHWPDPSLPDLRHQGLQTLWRDRAIFQHTELSGFTGFGLGTGSYIRDMDEGGPHVVWVLSPSIPSDGMSGIGMLGGTNHKGPLFLTFQIGRDPEPVNSLRELLLTTGEREQLIRFNPQAALQRRIVLDGFFPNSNEFDVEWEGVQYIGQRTEDMVSGEVRVYYVPRCDWENVRYEVR